MRREVWRRDGGQCAFVGAEARCTERGFLEFHHVEPYAAGGTAGVHNIQLRCRAHNVYEAEQYFGARLPLLAREGRERYTAHSVRTEVQYSRLCGAPPRRDVSLPPASLLLCVR